MKNIQLDNEIAKSKLAFKTFMKLSLKELTNIAFISGLDIKHYITKKCITLGLMHSLKIYLPKECKNW